ncbi:MAG TPA: cyclic nucleotide-binding domain-containing protein [Candidatus Methanoperedens sp.]|nr:cyclic nucleotide-binding domain-containing protein [Candidatus Methanoperedens sp.]
MPDPQRDSPAVALTPEIVAYLERAGLEVAAGPDEVLVRRGEPGRAFWVVLAGIVEVRLTGEDGVSLPLARLGAGATFGEMALVTGDPVSADVVALTPVRLLRYPAERFPCALGECEPLRALVMARMAANLRGTSTDVWNFFQQARALNVLMGPQRERGPLVAESTAMRPVREGIARLARERVPALVSGDPGTGKLFVAAKIHEGTGRAGAPFIAVDCRSLDPADALRFLCGTQSALQATEEDAGALRRYGALQLAHGGTLVLRHAESLPAPVREAVARYADTRRKGLPLYPATRLIATTTLAPGDFAAAAPELAAAFAGVGLVLPRLRERRRDILPLARLFLAAAARHEPKRLGASAEHALLSQRYAHRNVAELHEAIGMAVLISEGPEIGGEHVFTGPKGEGTVREVDLSRFPATKRLTSPGLLVSLRALVLALFASITAVSLAFPETAAGAVANALTWGLWEPALFVAFLLVGRVWCTVCPLSTAGQLAARLRCFGVSPGAWLKSHSVWFISGGFLLVIWSEHAFRMLARPRATGLLLLALFAAAIVSAVVWRREAWCRYLCPLGNLGAIYALPAVLTVRSNPSVCATMCTTHECFKGSGTLPGCPVYHHPLYANEAHACKQCYQCLRVCPHGSARLWLRLPFQSVWAQPDIGGALVPFALFVFFFAPAMLASQGSGWAATHAGFTATALGALAATALAASRLPRLLGAGERSEPVLATRVAFTLLVLAWGPAMAYQLAHVGVLASVRLHAAPQSLAARLLPAAGVPLLLVAQVAAVLLAGSLAGICLLGVRGRRQRDGEDCPRARWRLLHALCMAYLVAMLALVLTR